MWLRAVDITLEIILCTEIELGIILSSSQIFAGQRVKALRPLADATVCDRG